MWAYRSFDLPLNAFDFTVSRHREGPQEILLNFDGTLMADCYAGFDAITVESLASIRRAGCSAHARRKFIELKSDVATAANYLRNNWTELSTYVDDPSCSIDNNDTEQLMRQVAVGREELSIVVF
jgi:hypothetical protein